MKSFTELKNDFGIDTKNTSVANLAWGATVMNDFHRRILSKMDWPFLHRLRTAKTVANTSFVNLPYDIDLVESVFITIGSTRYPVKPAPTRAFWDKLHYSSYNSDTPEYWFVYNGQIGIYPQPSTSDNVISIDGKVRAVDLNVEDYTTGSVVSATNLDETVTLVGTTLTYPMAGRWLRITGDDSTTSGDGVWYEIASITDTTHLELVRKYGGTTIATATQVYKLGMMPLLPEAYHNLPEAYGAFRYWAKENDKNRMSVFKLIVEEGLEDLAKEYGKDDLSVVIDSGLDDFIENPNLFLTL